MDATPPLTSDIKLLAAAFAASGAMHLVRPQTFEPIMPRFLPAHRALVVLSGLAELICAAGLISERGRRAAGWSSAALLLAVYPANITMVKRAREAGDRRLEAISWARLPLQLPLIRSALRAAGR